MKPILPPSHRAGFTLIELLVVIGIIAVLSALSVGGAIRAKLVAQRIGCVNNLRQWGYATRLYTEDHNDRLPREAAMDGINSWQMTASPMHRSVWYNVLPATIGTPTMAHYAETPSSQQAFYSKPNLFHCPRARFSAVSATYPNFSLAINSKLMLDYEAAPISADPMQNTLRMKEIRVPERTALFLDCGVPGEQKLTPFQMNYTGQPKAYANQFSGRHSSSGNILFAAGHVLGLRGSDVVDMDPNSLHRGGAILPPSKVIWTPDPGVVP